MSKKNTNELMIQLLESKLEKMTGKKVVYKDKASLKEAKLAKLKESIKLLEDAYKAIEEGKEGEEEKLDEGLFDTIKKGVQAVGTHLGVTDEGMKNSMMTRINSSPGLKAMWDRTAVDVQNAILQKAAADSYKGVITIKKDKTGLDYFPTTQIKSSVGMLGQTT